MVYPEQLNLDKITRKESTKSNSSWMSADDNPEIDELSKTVNDIKSNTEIISKRVREEEYKHKMELRDNEDDVSFESEVISKEQKYGESEVPNTFQDENRQFIQNRIRHLVDAFTYRAQTAKELDFPPTPSPLDSKDDLLETPPIKLKPPALVSLELTEICQVSPKKKTYNNPFAYLKDALCNGVIDPQGKVYVLWMSIVAFAVLYNVWVIPFRATFPYQNNDNRILWMGMDYAADVIYLLDMLMIQPRIIFLSEGFWMKDIHFTRQNYLRTNKFKLDLISLLPLDLFYIYFGTEMGALRIPRFFKLHTFWAFFNIADRLIASPHIVRIARSLLYMVYLIHLNASAYYAFSKWKGIGSNSFVFNGKGNAYIKCFHFATKIVTSIGKNPKPTEEVEFVFMTICWLMGVFVFALLIGQIRDIFATATRAQTEYRKLVDETLEYMRRLNLPQEMQKRVQMWFSYTWKTQHTLDENTIMDCLPHKMKTDIAINVHIELLSKVKLFADCDEALLRELVLQLKSVIYLPGDCICKKGDVGKAMYIIQSGRVQVLGKDENDVLATLTEGSVFGEISLLGIGKNRRTADVRSKGYSNLFVLSKDDLNAALPNYPEAQELLNRKAKQLMQKNEEIERKRKEAMIIINNPEPVTPHAKLIEAVLQATSHESATAYRLLRYGSRGQANRTDRSRRPVHRNQSMPCVRDTTFSFDREGNGDDSTFQTRVTVHRSIN